MDSRVADGLRVNNRDLAEPHLGKNAVYLASGKNAGEFAVCNRNDLERGLAGITLQLDESGRRINANSKLQLRSASLSAQVPNLYQGYDATFNQPLWSSRKTYHQDIQAAASVVLLEYNGEQYAIVSDFNLWFNDPLTTGSSSDMPRPQIGGKIGIVQNPFGKNGQSPVHPGQSHEC